MHARRCKSREVLTSKFADGKFGLCLAKVLHGFALTQFSCENLILSDHPSTSFQI